MGPGDAGTSTDLDALIGEIRREAARRRAAPDFPLDDEARLTVEMDQQGPAGPGGADLAALVAALRAVDRQGDPGEVAGLAASALTALSVRVAQLERRAATAAATTAPTTASPPTDAGAPDLPAIWLEAVAEQAPTAAGRILVAGPGAAAWVDRLAAADLGDAYGVDPAGEPFGDRAAVRTGPVLEHLATVGDGALALAVVAGPLDQAEATRLDHLTAELARTSPRAVAVCAESPWAWRRRLGDAAADTSPTRPVGPEAWLSALSGAGLVPTGRYDPDGRSFLVVAGTAAGKAAQKAGE